MYIARLTRALPMALALMASVSAAPLDIRQTSWPDPAQCTGNISYVHDPSVIRRESDGTWFRLSTNGNIAIASAPSISGPWTYQGAMLPQGSSIQLANGQQIWAPDVSLIGNTYYAFYAVSTLGSQTSSIGMATSPSLEPGTWTDHGSINLPASSQYNLIDPNLFFAGPTSTYYLSFGSGWDDIFSTVMNSELTAQYGGAETQNLVRNSTGSVTEGSYQFQWEVNGVMYNYLFFSQGICCPDQANLPPAGDEYKVMVCRSTSPTGPFTDQNNNNCQSDNGGTLVLGSHGNTYAPGGQGVMVDTDTNRVAMYYHYINPSIGYDYSQFQFGYNYLDFSSGWPVVVT